MLFLLKECSCTCDVITKLRSGVLAALKRTETTGEKYEENSLGTSNENVK